MVTSESGDVAVRTSTRRPLVGVLPYAVVVVVYAATFLLTPHDGFWINDNGCKFIQVQALIRSDYQAYDIPWPGRDLDPRFVFNPLPEPFGHVVDGKLYATFSPVFPLLSSFPYRAIGFAGLYLLPLLSGLLLLPAVGALAGLLDGSGRGRSWCRGLAVIVVALGTPVWFYSVTFWEHLPAVCLTTWGVVFYLRFVAGQAPRQLAVSAVLCGLSVYFRDELYVFGAVAAVLTIFTGRRRLHAFLLFCGVFVGVLVPLWLFQWLTLGKPFGWHFQTDSLLQTGILAHLRDRGGVVRRLLLNSHGNAWLSAALSIPYLGLLVFFPRLRDRVFRWATVVLAGAAVIGGIVVFVGFETANNPVLWTMSANGLFAVSPVLILAFLRPRNVCGRKGGEAGGRARKTLWLILLFYVAAYALVTPRLHAGGIHWGCRYLLPMFPLMGAGACVTVRHWWSANRDVLGRGIVILMIASSVGLQVYSVDLLRDRKRESAEVNRVFREYPEQIVVATSWFVPQELSRGFFDRQVFLVRNPQVMRSLFRELSRCGVPEVLMVISHRPGSATNDRTRVMRLGHADLAFVPYRLPPA